MVLSARSLAEIIARKGLSTRLGEKMKHLFIHALHKYFLSSYRKFWGYGREQKSWTLPSGVYDVVGEINLIKYSHIYVYIIMTVTKCKREKYRELQEMVT